MKTAKFKMLIDALDSLNARQNRLLKEELAARSERKKVSHTLETPKESIECPHCHNKNIVRWGKRSDMQRYRCKSCLRTFNSLTGTPLAHLRRKGHWLDYADCLKKGLTIRHAAKICEISTVTAFKWRHRFLQNATAIKAPKLEGIIEVREAFYRKSEKGNRKLNRKARKRGNDKSFSPAKHGRICLLISRDRNRNTVDHILEKLSSKALTMKLRSYIAHDALFCSNSRIPYLKFTNETNVRHGKLKLSNGEYIKKSIVHIRNAISYQSEIKQWIIYRFHGVATKYLNSYLAWYRELDEYNFTISPQIILLRAKAKSPYNHQPLCST